MEQAFLHSSHHCTRTSVMLGELMNLLGPQEPPEKGGGRGACGKEHGPKGTGTDRRQKLAREGLTMKLKPKSK